MSSHEGEDVHKCRQYTSFEILIEFLVIGNLDFSIESAGLNRVANLINDIPCTPLAPGALLASRSSRSGPKERPRWILRVRLCASKARASSLTAERRAAFLK